MRFDRWPLGINSEMDRHAATYGLSHWSCVSPLGNEWWVRKDGMNHECFTPGSLSTYPEELRQFDKRVPMKEN